MKSPITFCLLTSIYFLVPVQCSNKDKIDDIVLTLEGLQIVNEPLSFSFNKDNFTDFRCNFNDKILTHNSLYTPPFFHSEPVCNFFSTFCLIFQYSLIIHEEEFKQVIEKIFSYYLEKLHLIRKNISKFSYDPHTFQDCLTKMKEKINKILIEEDENYQFVNVKENEGRITITLNESSSIYHLKLFEEFSKDLVIPDLDEEIEDAMVLFNIKFNEMYLSDKLDSGYLKSLMLLIKEYFERIEGVIDFETSSDNELLEFFADVLELSIENNRNELENNSGDFKKDFQESFVKYLEIFAGKYFSGEMPMYLHNLISKVRTKALFETTEGSAGLDIFYLYPKEQVKSLFSLKKMLTEFLKDSSKISYGNKMLSDESVTNLVKNCLEMDI